MIVTGIIAAGIVIYAIWAVWKIHRDRKNGSCCGSNCSGCAGKEYCSK
ncbi:FeoB-associated Cys-rich membrane protein [Ruthenibacterium lactatiformans]|nr:FeoB-associated Cys-rich membrane protein [Ruthenibacterium lactatiformans]